MRIQSSSFSGCGFLAKAVLLIVGMAAAARGEPASEAIESDPYPLENCVVMQGPLPKGAQVIDVGDREIRVCCEDCVGTFRSQANHWLPIVDERIKDQQRDFYPRDTCVVDGTKLDDFNRQDFVFRNRLFRLCSEDCQKKLEQNPAKYFALVNRAVVEKQKARYPLNKCIVSGQPLGKSAVDHVVGNQLVRLADADQIEAFNKSPGEYLAKVRAAAKKTAK